MKNNQKVFVISLIIIIVTLLVIGGAYIYVNKKTRNYQTTNVPKIVDIIATSTAAITTNNIATTTNIETIDNKFDFKDNSYIYGMYKDKILFYEKIDKYNISVYISEGGIKTEIIKGLSTNFQGGPESMPQFGKTSNPSIVGLQGLGVDYNSPIIYKYYINLDSGKVLSLNQTDYNIKITDFNGIISTINPLIVDNCGIGNNAVLKDVALNGIPQNVITQTYALKCNNDYLSEGLGGVPYDPYPEIHYSGISSDLSKIFFHVKISNFSDGDVENVLLRKDFSYDLMNKVIKEESYSSVVSPISKDVGKIAISIQSDLWADGNARLYIDGKQESGLSLGKTFLSRDLPVGPHWVQLIGGNCNIYPKFGGNYTIIKDKIIGLDFKLSSCIPG